MFGFSRCGLSFQKWSRMRSQWRRSIGGASAEPAASCERAVLLSDSLAAGAEAEDAVLDEHSAAAAAAGWSERAADKSDSDGRRKRMVPLRNSSSSLL